MKRQKLILGSLLLTLQPMAMHGQDTRGTLGGRVEDSSGAAVAGASVTVKSVETGVERELKTNKSGEWLVNSLNPGHYTFTVEAPSFNLLSHSSIAIQVSDRKIIDSRLQPGEQSATVTVITDSLTDVTSSVSGTVISGEQLNETPNESNVPTLLAGLSPGVLATPPAIPARLWSNAAGSGITVDSAGAFNSAVNYTIDGGNDTTGGGQVAFIPPTDAVAEFRVATNAYDAAIGRTAAGTIQLVSKSGGNHYHGTIFEFNQTNFGNANRSINKKNATTVPLPHQEYNEFGATIGGPVSIPFLYSGVAHKSFLFFAFDGTEQKVPINTGTMSLPTALERTGDYSQSFTTLGTTRFPVTIYDPLTYNPLTGTRQPFLNNKIDPARIDPVAKAVYALLPLPDNVGDGTSTDSNNFIKRNVQNDSFRSYQGRFDQTWNDRNVSYLSVRYNNLFEEAYNPFGGNNPLQGQDLIRINYGATADHTITITPKLVADLRYNITRYESTSQANGAGLSPTTLGFNQSLAGLSQLASLPQLTGVVGNPEIGGLGTNQAGTYTLDTSHQFSLNVTQTAGRHNLHYGVEYFLRQEAQSSLGTSSGTFNFGPQWTTRNPDATAGTGEGNADAGFFLGLATSGSIPNAATSFFSSPYYGIYVQDDWRVNDRFTLNAGLRYDVEVPAADRYNRFWNRYDLNYVQTDITTFSQPKYAALLAQSSTNPGVNLLQTFRPNTSSFVTKGGIQYAGVNGVSNRIDDTRFKYFQPRLGFAYRFQKDTVLRGGLGRFVEGTFFPKTGGTSQYGYSTTTPFTPTTDNFHTISGTLDNPFTSTIAVTGNSLGEGTFPGFAGSYNSPNYGRSYTDEASLHLEQQIKDYLIEIGGSLNFTHGLTVGARSINLPGQAAWLAAFNPAFDATGRPLNTLPGFTQVANPFLGAPGVVSGVQTTKTVYAYTLLDPSPLNGISNGGGFGTLGYDNPIGKNYYYSLQTKIERRFHNGFSLLNAFTWSKTISETNTIGPQDYAFVVERRLSQFDQKFIETLAPIYDLPFGRGRQFASGVNRVANQIIGGWQLAGIYRFVSGTPVVLPTNSNFFEGGNPALTPTGNLGKFIDTSRFIPYPGSNTSNADVHNLTKYPAWTGIQGLPGFGYTPAATDSIKNGVYQDFTDRVTYNQTTFGNLRQPFYNVLDLGVRKNFKIYEDKRLELRFDAFNALNHPIFGNIGTNAASQYFGNVGGTNIGSVDQVNQPRAIQLSGRIYF